jgi:hypothetical protein
VVYMGKGLQTVGDRQHDILRLHHQMLASVHQGRFVTSFLGRGYPYLTSRIVDPTLDLHSLEKAQASHVYTYSSGFQGFTAKLNKEQAMRLAGNFHAPNTVSENMY